MRARLIRALTRAGKIAVVALVTTATLSAQAPPALDVATSDPPPPAASRKQERPDANRAIFYKNKLEFSVESGYLPMNIPFVFDFLLGGGYKQTPRMYTLVPTILSLRWQPRDIGGRWIFRGTWEYSFSGAATIIPSGPETRYFAYDMGIRRYFVPRNARIVPFMDGRLGVGDINAKEPYGVEWAQGQDLTFTLILGSGFRYDLSRRYSMWGGVSYMHVSNLYLSEPRYLNYGINVVGPMFGFDMKIAKKRER